MGHGWETVCRKGWAALANLCFYFFIIFFLLLSCQNKLIWGIFFPASLPLRCRKAKQKLPPGWPTFRSCFVGDFFPPTTNHHLFETLLPVQAAAEQGRCRARSPHGLFSARGSNKAVGRGCT